jgi:hypothetical protein
VSGHDLFFKWEAMKYHSGTNSSVMRVFEKKDISALKERMQRDLDAEKAKKQPAPNARPNLNGLLGRNLMNIGRPSIKAEPRDSKLTASTIAGPSKVKFSSADLDNTTTSQRKCKSICL